MEISLPDAATPMTIDWPQPLDTRQKHGFHGVSRAKPARADAIGCAAKGACLCAASSAARMTSTLPMHSNV